MRGFSCASCLVAHKTDSSLFSSVASLGRIHTYHVILRRVRIITSWTPIVHKSRSPCYPDEYILYSGAENFEMSCRFLENFCTPGPTIHCTAFPVNIAECYNRLKCVIMFVCRMYYSCVCVEFVCCKC